MDVIPCDWCSQEKKVRRIGQELLDFWYIISTDPTVGYRENICDCCVAHVEDFSAFIEVCKKNEALVEEVRFSGEVKEEPPIDFTNTKEIKEEILEDSSEPIQPLVLNAYIKQYSTHTKKLEAVNCEKPFTYFETHTGELFRCSRSHCGKTFARSDTLKRHLWTHSNGELLKCFDCDKTFSDLNTLKIHSRLHTVEGILNEEPCVITPWRTDTDRKLFKCLDCDKTFSTSSGLKTHSRLHTGIGLHECSYCDKRIAAVGLKKHLLIHTSERPYECPLCDKAFTQAAHLKTHSFTHTGEKPFKCSHCEKSFVSARDLKQHSNTHIDEKPLKCLDCDKAFCSFYGLKTHSRLHTGKGLLICPHCDKLCTTAYHLKTHILTHTGERPHKCSHCNKTFSQAGHLKIHLNTHTLLLTERI